ncbi:MAG: putative inorganic carbon transporter subunit DabA, partial [Methylococcaceae bacterium]
MSDTGHDWITSSVSCTDDEALALIRAAVDHLDHLLPGQAPLLMFVHHNTLHGYQWLPFHEALSRYQALTGIRGYLPDQQFRHFFQTGRILLRDLLAEFVHHPSLAAEEILLERDDLCIRRSDLYTIALLYGLDPLTSSELAWQIEEKGVLDQFQPDVPPEARHRYLNSCRSNQPGASREECRSIQNLWQACLGILQLEYHPLDPEALTDLASYPVEHLLHPDEFGAYAPDARPLIHLRMQAEAGGLLESLWQELNTGLTLRTLLLKLTGEDMLDAIRPELIRYAASHLDESVAAWHCPDRHLGLYANWREHVLADPSLLPGDHAEIQSVTLPAQSVEAVHQELVLLGLSPNHWSGYLHRLALELPGWAGLINWRYQRPQHPAN